MKTRIIAPLLAAIALTVSANASAVEPVALALPTVWEESYTCPANASGQWSMDAYQPVLGITVNVVVNPLPETSADLVARCRNLRDDAKKVGDMVTGITVNLKEKYCDFQSVGMGRQHYYRVSSPDAVHGRTIVMQAAFSLQTDSRKAIKEMAALADLFVTVTR